MSKRKRKPPLPPNYRAPLPELHTDGEELRRAHRLSVQQATPPIPHTGHMRHAAEMRLRKALSTTKARALCAATTEAEATGNPEAHLAATRALLQHLDSLLPEGWEACFGDSLVGESYRTPAPTP